MPFIATQVGPYGFFNLGTTTKQILTNKGGVVTPVKQILTNKSGVVTPVKQIWANDGGSLVCKYTSTKTIIFDLNNGAASASAMYDPSMDGYLYYVFFTWNNQRAYLPSGWSGKISFWQGADNNSPPSNTPNSSTQGWSYNTNGGNPVGNFGPAYVQWYVQHQTTLSSNYPLNTNSATTNTTYIPVNGVIPAWLNPIPLPLSGSLVNSAHETPYINSDGTPFSFNKHYLISPLTNPCYGWLIAFDLGGIHYINTYGKLRMAITTTSTVQPTLGSGTSPANSGWY